MKNYSIETDLEGNTKSVELINEDEDRIIEYICFSLTMVSPSSSIVLYSLEIRFDEDEETPEMRQEFLKINKHNLALDLELLECHVELDIILKYIKLADSIDPIPKQVYFDVMEILPQYDLSSIVNKSAIQHLVEKGKHARALKLACKLDGKGNTDALSYLSNLYCESADFEHYRNVLLYIPTTNKSFVFANITLHEYYQSISPEDVKSPKDKIDLLEKKFRSAMNAGLNNEAANYFDELCGNTGIRPTLTSVKGDVDTLILIARKQREMKNEIDNLKAMLLEKTEPKPPAARLRIF